MTKLLKNLWPFLALIAFGVALYFYANRPAAPSRATPAPTPAPTATPPPAAPKSTPSNSSAALPPDLASALALPDLRERARTFGTAFLALLARDPAAALATVRALPPGNERTSALLATLDALSRTDPARALALAAELAVTRDERVIYNLLFDRFARENPAAAIARLAAVPTGESRENSLRALVDGWSASSVPAALDWSLSLAGPDRAVALESSLVNLLGTDPLRAIELAQKHLTDPALSRTVLTALQHLVTTDAPAAARLTALLPAGELQAQAVASVARPFAAGDSAAALVWSESFTGTTRRTALANTALGWADRDPAAAAAWLITLPPASTFPDTLPNVFAAWLRTNATAARTWLATAPLPPETKSALDSRPR